MQKNVLSPVVERDEKLSKNFSSRRWKRNKTRSIRVKPDKIHPTTAKGREEEGDREKGGKF